MGINWSPTFNCWDFAKLILLQELGIDASTAFDKVLNPLSTSESGEAIESGAKGLFAEVSSPLPLHLCVMGRGETVHHIAVVVDSEFVIHNNKGMPACCTSIEELKTKFKTIKFYKYANNHTN